MLESRRTARMSRDRIINVTEMFNYCSSVSKLLDVC